MNLKMDKQMLFVHGGGGKEDYEADAKLVASLREALGEDFEVHYPFFSDDSTPDFGRKKQIGREISLISGKILLVGHSLGASMLLKYLSESGTDRHFGGVFLLATPFWNGDEDWKEGLKLPEDFPERLPKNLPVFLYHSEDDEVVVVNHLELYSQKMPAANVRRIATGGHQFNNDLKMVARDIKFLFEMPIEFK